MLSAQGDRPSLVGQDVAQSGVEQHALVPREVGDERSVVVSVSGNLAERPSRGVGRRVADQLIEVRERANLGRVARVEQLQRIASGKGLRLRPIEQGALATADQEQVVALDAEAIARLQATLRVDVNEVHARKPGRVGRH